MRTLLALALSQLWLRYAVSSEQLRSSGETARPHLVMVLIDDLGFDDFYQSVRGTKRDENLLKYLYPCRRRTKLLTSTQHLVSRYPS